MCSFEDSNKIVELFDNLDDIAPVKAITVNDFHRIRKQEEYF